MSDTITRIIHRSADRGRTRLAWLDSRHSFSFGQHRDPSRMNYRSLRVLNDDIVAPGAGFGRHGHDNMEIISWVLDGALEHQDSTGERGILVPGDVQVMTAGAGIEHSEANGSSTDPVHFLQIWIEPAERDLEPAHAQRTIPSDARRNRWALIASGDVERDALRVHQDAYLFVADLDAGRGLDAGVEPGRHGYLHVIDGVISIGGERLETGDAIEWRGDLHITADRTSQLLRFDLT